MQLLTLFSQTYYYDGQYDYSSPEAQAASAGVIIFMLLFSLLLAAAAYILNSILLGKIFKKAGIESWRAWVPVYNNWIMLELGGQPGWWSVLAFIPIVNIAAAVFLFIAMYNIGLKLGKEGAFVLLAIFLYIVWLIWLAVDNSTWNESAGKPSLTPVNPPQNTTPPATTA